MPTFDNSYFRKTYLPSENVWHTVIFTQVTIQSHSVNIQKEE